MDFPEVISTANRTGVQFLLTDANTDLTFMDVAEASTAPENVLRNHMNARKAYDAILRLLENLHPDENQRKELD
jgi:hypothetical protein